MPGPDDQNGRLPGATDEAAHGRRQPLVRREDLGPWRAEITSLIIALVISLGRIAISVPFPFLGGTTDINIYFLPPAAAILTLIWPRYWIRICAILALVYGLLHLIPLAFALVSLGRPVVRIVVYFLPFMMVTVALLTFPVGFVCSALGRRLRA